MKKIIVVSDSFKGTISSLEICDIAKALARQYLPDCRLVTIPVADGGEGTVDCFISAMNAQQVDVVVSGPYNTPIAAKYARIGRTAIIEMAAAAGLPAVGDRKDPSLTTTIGVGQMILHAICNGCDRILLGLGGSATNDGGCGAAAALGVKFANANGHYFIPVGATLHDVEFIDVSKAEELLENIEITVMSDVENPLCGPNGAAHVFGPQKGADPQMVEELDEGLKHLSEVIRRVLSVDVENIRGSGAAGGMGAGCVAFMNAEIRSGIESILSITGYERELCSASLVITGEGCLDSQSLQGKVISGVASKAKSAKVPVYAVVGCTGEGAEDAYAVGVSRIFTTSPPGLSMEEIIPRAKRDYTATLKKVLTEFM